jgi:hypothetical protein
VATNRKRLNRKLIATNLSEAIEELERIRGLALTGELKEEQLQVFLLHAYHHLNFAWNIRRIRSSEYAKLTAAQVKRWGKYPSEIEER